MKTIKSLAYPVLVIAVWVFFAVASLSGLRTIEASLRSISGGAPPAPSPSETTGQLPIIAARGRDLHQESRAATLEVASTGAQATGLRAPAPMPPASPAPPQPQDSSPHFTPLPAQRNVTAVAEKQSTASAVAQVIEQAQQENDELGQIDRELAQEAADEAWRREADAARAVARHAATLEALATLRRSDALLATGDSDGVDDELARAAAALSGRTLLDVEAAREALAREDLYPARQYLKAALARRRLPR